MTTIGVFAAVFDEHGHVLCVRQDYGDRVWGMPGGRLERGEDPVSALEREAFEEAGVTVDVLGFVGAYSASYRDDLVLLFTAVVRQRAPWAANNEISEIGFFPLHALPEPMSENARLRFHDVAAGEAGILRTLSSPGVVHEERSLSARLPQKAR